MLCNPQRERERAREGSNFGYCEGMAPAPIIAQINEGAVASERGVKDDVTQLVAGYLYCINGFTLFPTLLATNSNPDGML